MPAPAEVGATHGTAALDFHSRGNDAIKFRYKSVHSGSASKEVEIELITSAGPILERMRSLLIIIGEESTSRRCLPRENSVSFLYPDNPDALSAFMTMETANSEASTLSMFIMV